jgi:hypothetical protein
MADASIMAALGSLCRGLAYVGYCLAMSLATLRNTPLSLNWRLRALYGFGQASGVFRRPDDGYRSKTGQYKPVCGALSGVMCRGRVNPLGLPRAAQIGRARAVSVPSCPVARNPTSPRRITSPDHVAGASQSIIRLGSSAFEVSP